MKYFQKLLILEQKKSDGPDYNTDGQDLVSRRFVAYSGPDEFVWRII